MASSSSSRPMKYQVFLSFRGGDTRLNFTSHLLKALKDTAMNVFFDELELERGEPLSSALSSTIAASNLSIIVLSKDYASSKSCLAEVSDIIGLKKSQGHIVLPIFYHVDPSDVRNIGDSFKTSFDFHESKGLPQVQQWKNAFAQVGQLKGWHIQGGLSDRSETEYIKDVVEYVIQKLNNKSKSVPEELVGIDDQREMILRLIGRQDIRVIGLWGMGGSGKTTLAEAVYNEISRNFEACCFVQNVREKIEKQGNESLRNDLISKLLNSVTCIDTPSIGSCITRDRMNNTRVIVVLDDVDDSGQIVGMGIKHFGPGSKIIVTSRDKQELENGGADKVHKVEMLNKNDSLQLFSTFAFKQLNPAVEFRDLSYKFLEYAQGSPLALKVLGSALHGKSREVWESEVFKLKEYAKPKIAQVLQRSYYGLDELEKNIFLDIAILYKGKRREEIEAILSSSYDESVVSAISSLLDKCLLEIIIKKVTYKGKPCQCISMHDMLEEMGKNIECKDYFEKRRRLWSPKDVIQLLKHKKWTDSVEGIKVRMHETDLLKWLCPTVFQNMHSLRSIEVSYHEHDCNSRELFAEVGSLPDELRYLEWEGYPFKSLSSSFNPSNLVVLRIFSTEQLKHLWNEDYQDLLHLREIDPSGCLNLRKIPTLLGAVKLKSIDLSFCYELRKIPTLSGAVNLKSIDLSYCRKLREIPTVSGAVRELVVEETQIEDLSKLLPYLRNLNAINCTSLEKVSFADQNLYPSDLLDDGVNNSEILMQFHGCISLNKDSVDNIVANAMLKIGTLAEIWAKKHVANAKLRFICCFPGDVIPENKFEFRSANSWLNSKIVPNRFGGNRFLGFAICLVVDLSDFNYSNCRCECQMTATGGGRYDIFKCGWYLQSVLLKDGDHVFILFSEEMFIKDKDYDEASIQFYFIQIYSREVLDDIKVKKCGVDVVYKDAKRDLDAATEMTPHQYTSSFSYVGDVVTDAGEGTEVITEPVDVDVVIEEDEAQLVEVMQEESHPVEPEFRGSSSFSYVGEGPKRLKYFNFL